MMQVECTVKEELLEWSHHKFEIHYMNEYMNESEIGPGVWKTFTCLLLLLGYK